MDEKKDAVGAFLILIDLWDDTTERILFSAAEYIYKTHLLEPETILPPTLGEFLYLGYEHFDVEL